MRTDSLLLSFVSTVLLAPAIARAQGAPAEALFDGGRESMARGDYARACRQFRESERLEPAVGTEFNLADCEERLGHLATAWQLFRGVEQKLPEGDERGPIAHGRSQALETRIPKLTLRLSPGAPASTTVRDGTVELGTASFGVALPLDPGRHDLVVSAPGHESRRLRIQLAASESRSLDVAPGDVVESSARAEVSPPAERLAERTPAARSSAGGDTKTLGYIVGGVGLAGIGTALVLGGVALGKKNTVQNQCDPATRLCNTQEGADAASAGSTIATASTICFIVGAVATGVGAYFVLTSKDEPTTTVGASAVAGGGMLRIARGF